MCRLVSPMNIKSSFYCCNVLQEFTTFRFMLSYKKLILGSPSLNVVIKLNYMTDPLRDRQMLRKKNQNKWCEHLASLSINPNLCLSICPSGFDQKLLPPSHYWNLPPVSPEVRNHRSEHAPTLRRARSGERARSRDTFLSEKRARGVTWTRRRRKDRLHRRVTCSKHSVVLQYAPARCSSSVQEWVSPGASH